MDRKSLTNRDDFESWLIYMDDALETFISGFPYAERLGLDFSPDSLNKIEAWILEQYPDTQAMLKPEQSRIVDGVARYIGETFRRMLGGHWDINLDNPKLAFFEMPILVQVRGSRTAICPLTLATATASRRTGKYLRSICDNMLNG